MSPRREVQDALGRFAFVYELLEGGSARAKTFANAARVIFQLQGDLAELRASGALARVRGIGPACLAVIDEVLAGREPAELAALEAQLPAGLFALREVRGLGPAKIRALHTGLGIATLGELEHACRENRLVSLAGFGEKTQTNVLAGVQVLRAREGKWLRDAAQTLAEQMRAALEGAGIEDVRVVGELAMGAEIVTRIELVAVGDAERFADAIGVARSDAALSQVVVFRADADCAGVVEVAHASEAEHFAALVSRAAELALALDATELRNADERRLPCATADALYAALGLLAVDAEARHAATPLARIGTVRKPLVRREDLRGALHNHTVASDGNATLVEMRAAAIAAGLSYLGISEHSVSADYARGLTVERLAAQAAEIAALNREAGTCALLTGIESDILADGSLDYTDDVLRTLEVVIASSHRRFSLDRATSTERMIRAARHRYTDILGHPTGRLLLGRAPLDFDVEQLLSACEESGCAVELNGSAHRLDFGARELAMAKERGVLVSIAADAHAPWELEAHLSHGIAVARRAGLTADDVLNTRDLAGLRAWLAARRTRALASA